ncbi:hypothetical protein MtrunA17_Chr8g0344171 [Medicago truncatula]|uniref:Uncharacterized protein n=1 Tax=Medicago truncatula TaxID=3880 RepID=A0A396GDF4_MEDTR|nr:hypothetical protein MtrunA17_Chr8g0344171 [Medicago truncatula]
MKNIFKDIKKNTKIKREMEKKNTMVSLIHARSPRNMCIDGKFVEPHVGPRAIAFSLSHAYK